MPKAHLRIAVVEAALEIPLEVLQRETGVVHLRRGHRRFGDGCCNSSMRQLCGIRYSTRRRRCVIRCVRCELRPWDFDEAVQDDTVRVQLALLVEEVEDDFVMAKR